MRKKNKCDEIFRELLEIMHAADRGEKIIMKIEKGVNAK